MPLLPLAVAALLALAPASAPAEAAPPAAPPAAAPAPAAAGYQGHGAASVSPELLARFAPRPIAPDLSRAVQAMLDVRAPGLGIPTRDGRRLFFGWRVTGVPQIWRLDGPDRFPVQLTGGEDATTLAALTPDGKTLVVQRDRKGEENPGLYLLSAEGGPLRLVQHRPGVQTVATHVSDDGRWLYYRANDRRPDAYAVYRHDLAGGTTELLVEEPGLWSVADSRLDGRLLLTKATGALSSEWFEWSPATRALTPLFGQGEQVEYQASYGAAEGELLVVTNKLGEHRRLYRWRAGQLAPVTPELGWSVEEAAIDRARRRILYTVNQAGSTRVAALDARTFKPLALPRLPPADHVLAGAASDDGRFQVLGVDTGTAPQASWVLDWKTGKLARWVVPSAPEVDTRRFARAELTSYPARDGTPIPAFVRRPAACPGGPCPVVVEFHGGPEAQTLAGFSARAQLYVDAGFVFVQPNVRGSDGYGKSWLQADDGARRLAIITDIEDAATWARRAFAVEGAAPRVGITGGSYGGYSALVGMTMFAGAYDAGASVVGIANLVTFLENTAPYRRILRTTEYGDPVKDREALVKLSPTSYVDRVRAPLLVQQGASDPRVPVGEAVQIHDALAARGVPVELVIFADEGHGAQKRENQVLMIGRTIEFFRRHLAPGGAVGAPR
ncbi:MAG: S9 family peptidase [Anaeromyxobacter sp.]|nr:S9 family peptidase [Anaeromyxobacter sp.]MBL0274849.1 S9 family peptidase [Anaeromyxobacter sp.]